MIPNAWSCSLSHEVSSVHTSTSSFPPWFLYQRNLMVSAWWEWCCVPAKSLLWSVCVTHWLLRSLHNQCSSLVLLLSCWLQVYSQSFACWPEFTRSALLKLPHYVFVLLHWTKIAISFLRQLYLGRDTTEKQWKITVILNQHLLGPLALLLKLQIRYYVCKAGTGKRNRLSLPWGFTPLWLSKVPLMYSCVPNWISASSKKNWGCEKTSKMYKNNLTAVI